jgi:hypothetical protein
MRDHREKVVACANCLLQFSDQLITWILFGLPRASIFFGAPFCARGRLLRRVARMLAIALACSGQTQIQVVTLMAVMFLPIASRGRDARGGH